MLWQTWLRRLLDGLILLLVGWLLLAAIYVSLGRQFMPVVADYQAELVVKAEQLSGRAIHLERLQGEMQGGQPVFKLRGLQVHADLDPDSPILFALDNVTARLDLFASLWQRRPVMDALQIQGLELELSENADGHWQVHGLGGQSAQLAGLDEALRLLSSQRRITLLETRIRISPWQQPDWVFSEGDLTLLNGPNWHRLDGQVNLPDGERLRWQASALMPGLDWQRLSLGFFLELPATNWGRWLPPAWMERMQIQTLVAGGQLWGSWQHQRLDHLQGLLITPQLELNGVRQVPVLNDLVARFEWREQAGQQSLRVDELSMRLDEEIWPATRIQLQRELESGAWLARVDQLPLEHLGHWLPGLIEHELTAEVISTLAPRGTLRDVQLNGTSDWRDWRNLRLQARLDRVGVSAWEAVPAFEGVSGSLSGSPAEGELRVASDNWAIHLPRLFPQAWHYTRAEGALQWRWSDELGLSLIAPGLRATGEEGPLTARMELLLPPPGGVPTMDLRVALRDSQARFHERYLPTLAPAFEPALADWLKDSQLSGRVPQAIFAYRGSLLKDAEPDERQIDLYARLEGGSLQFQPGWPGLSEVSATLYLDNELLDIGPGQARLLDTELSGIQVSTRRESPEAALRLLVAGDFKGPLSDALTLMQDSPLAELSGDPLAGWQGQGQVDGQLALAIPLRQGQPLGVDVGWQAEVEQLQIPQLQEPIHELRGRFAYNDGQGLAASGLTLRFLGEPVAAEIDRIDAQQRIRLSGKHSLERLQGWTLLGGEALPKGLASGALDWQADVRLAEGRQRVEVSSALEGVSLALPEPLAKSGAERLPSRLLLELTPGLQRWQFNLGPELRGLIHIDERQFAGDLRYRSGSPVTPIWPGLAVQARFRDFDWSHWQQWLDGSALKPADTPLAQAPAGQMGDLVQRLNVQTDRFQGFGLDLDNVQVSGARTSNGWLLDIEQSSLRGQIGWPDANDAPVVVELQRLTLPRHEPGPDHTALVEPVVPEDPLAAFDPTSLPSLDVRIHALHWGDELVGGVRFSARPSSTGSHFSGVDVDLRGLRLQGDLDWLNSGSRFSGELNATDLGAVLQAWHYAPTLTSERFQARTELSWPGSPAFFALARSSGTVSLDASNGALQSGEGSADALRVFGLLNFNALTRRLRLDFSDLFGKGTAYDSFKGELGLDAGVMHTRTPLVMDGPSAKLQLEGQLDLPNDQIDMGLLVTLPVTNNLPLAAILAGAPHIGGVLFLADRILGDRVARFASVKYRISGDWQQPNVEFDRAFDSKAALEN